MNVIAKLNEELVKGFSRSQLEILIKLPKNNLSGMIAGNRKISRKSMVKITSYFKDENRPGPFDLPPQKEEKKENIDIKSKEKLAENNDVENNEKHVNPEVPKLDFQGIMKLAKDGASKSDVEAAIKSNGKLNGRQTEMIRSKIIK